MEANICPVNCVRWQIEKRCAHVKNTQVQADRLALEKIKEAKRQEAERERGWRVAQELEPVVWRCISDWQELPHKEGVYVWVMNGKPLMTGGFVDLWRGHYALCRAGRMLYISEAVVWWLETALTKEIVEFLKTRLWGGEEYYRKTIAQALFNDEVRRETLQMHPMKALWPVVVTEAPEETTSHIIELGFWL
jgi:hypothetical protein